MSALLTAADVAEGALRQIGALSPYDTAADPEEQAIAIERLDLLVSELAGTHRLWWLVPAAQTLVLTAGVGEYLLGGLSPRLEFLHSVQLVEASGEESDVELVRRSVYEAIPDKAEAGVPVLAHVTRDATPRLWLHPVPATAGLRLRIDGQAYSADIDKQAGRIAHGFPAAWQRFLIYALAADIGRGPVRRLPAGVVDDFDRVADRAKSSLLTYNGREQVRRPRFTQPWGL
jgi:hypothetical protein